MLWQIHQQYKDHTVMVAQKEINSYDELEEFLHNMRDTYPLPEGAIWMWCNENSPDFVKTEGDTSDITQEIILHPGFDDLWEWFELSHASFLTLPRVLMHEMPDEWQKDMARLLREYDCEFPNQPPLKTYVSVKKDTRFIKPPEWLINYRHPDWWTIAKLRNINDKWEE